MRPNPDGSVDASFAPIFAVQSGTYRAFSAGVYAVAVQPDGKILAAGSFDLVNGHAHRGVVRLNADGSLDSRFDPAVPAHVYPAQGLDNDASSHLYLNGRAVGAVGRYLPDGRMDKSFYPGLDPLAVNGAAAGASSVAVRNDGMILIGGDFDTVDGQFRHHLAGLLGSPTADCPVVNVLAQTPLVIASNGSGSLEQDGKLIAKVKAPVTTALGLNYSVSGKGTSWVAPGTFSLGTVTIPVGARKAKLRVAPSPYAFYGLGNGKNLKFQVEAGRGYVVGSGDTAKLRIVVGNAAAN